MDLNAERFCTELDLLEELHDKKKNQKSLQKGAYRIQNLTREDVSRTWNVGHQKFYFSYINITSVLFLTIDIFFFL